VSYFATCEAEYWGDRIAGRIFVGLVDCRDTKWELLWRDSEGKKDIYRGDFTHCGVRTYFYVMSRPHCFTVKGFAPFNSCPLVPSFVSIPLKPSVYYLAYTADHPTFEKPSSTVLTLAIPFATPTRQQPQSPHSCPPQSNLLVSFPSPSLAATMHKHRPRSTVDTG
jgi:hypothetical protein